MFAKRFIAMICVAVTLASCASLRTPMTDFATDYNRVIADTRNEMILLNIVRASFREPTHYSTLSQVTGNIAFNAGAGAGFSGILDDIDAGANVSLGVRSAPTFQIVPLNTSEFAGGILRPIEPNVVAIFLGQGWNENRLAALLIESLKCGDETFHNDLRRDGAADENRFYLSREQVAGLGFDARAARSGGDEPLAIIDAGEASTLRAVLEEMGDDYDVTINRRPDGGAVFEVRESIPQQLHVTTASAGDGAFCGGRTLTPSDYQLRSVQGVVYYLGEVLRTGRPLRIDDRRTLFTAHNRPPSGQHGVHVRHRGQDWYIADAAANPDDRSIQTIGLISQLIGLQTSSDALDRSPSTLTIN